MHNPNQRRFRFRSAAAEFPSFFPKKVEEIKNPFVQELFERNPLPVFREEEYGVADIFYAAARSKNVEFFRLFFDFAVSPSGEVGTPLVPPPCHLLQLFCSS
ncbi:hypothetical protein ACFX2I_025019 [Malus domestica]